MALLVLYAQPSLRPGDPGAYDDGDCIEVLPDGQHPGNNNAKNPALAFVSVPGTRDEWLHLKEEYNLTAMDPENLPYNVEMLARRKRKVTVLEDDATKANALDWDRKPTMTKDVVDAATVDKSKPVVP